MYDLNPKHARHWWTWITWHTSFLKINASQVTASRIRAGSWCCQRPDPPRPELGWAGLAQVSSSIALQAAINIAKPTREELQHQQNEKALCDTLLLYLCTFRLGTSQADRAWWGHTKGKLEERAVETSKSNNQCSADWVLLTERKYEENWRCLNLNAHPSLLSHICLCL